MRLRGGVCVRAWQILDFVRVAVNLRKVNLLAVDRNLIDESDALSFELPVDSMLHEFTVSLSGKHPSIDVTDPQGQPASSLCE